MTTEEAKKNPKARNGAGYVGSTWGGLVHNGFALYRSLRRKVVDLHQLRLGRPAYVA